ncbi:MAG: hypothetical protein JXK94_13200 [Deltaproteobacteria bacterium]|nr:hypothetical protein [Deltaproteobacteria bacterium]
MKSIKPNHTQAAILRARRIKSRLVAMGVKQVDIARDLRVTRGHVSAVICGAYASPRVETRIAELLGEDPGKLWGKKA